MSGSILTSRRSERERIVIPVTVDRDEHSNSPRVGSPQRDESYAVVTTKWAFAMAQQRAEHWQEAEAAWQEALSAAQRSGKKDAKAAVESRLGSLYRLTGRPDEAIACFEAAHAIWSSRGDAEGIAHTLFGLGAAHQEKGDSKAALAYHSKHLHIVQKRGDQMALVAKAWYGMGKAHSHLGQPRQAIDCYTNATDSYGKVWDFDGAGRSLQCLSILHAACSDPGKAADCQQRAAVALRRNRQTLRQESTT